jgi:hypothetical protein
MVIDFNPNQQTPWGNRIIHGANGIQPTSREASIYSGDRNPVVSSIRRGKPNPTSGASVNFTVTFSEAVTGVNTIGTLSDFTLTTTGVTSAAITSISGSGATRVVTVSTGSGSGTIRLNVVDNGSIKDENNNSLAGPQTDNGNYTSGETYTITKPTNVDISVGGVLEAQYFVPHNGSTRQSFVGLNNGPVKITNTAALPMIAAERVIYKVNGVFTSFTEMMALPTSQLDTIYWLPWYNNVDLDTQLRFANVSNQQATVRIFIGGQEMQGSPVTLAAGASTRQSFTGINAGPVKIESNVNIVAAERVIYKVNGVYTSFSETMALPNKQLSNTYWLPWYNNIDQDKQLRIANVTDQAATVTVTIGGVQKPPISLAARASTRVSYASVNVGPVKIQSNQNIVVAERVIYKVNGIPTSFSEMMALPNDLLSNNYWLSWYNNVDLDTQLRITNVSTSTATVHVYVGGVEMQGSPFNLPAGSGLHKSYLGVNNGAVNIVSNQSIVVSERVIYKAAGGVNTSFSEMMGLPHGLLDITYWLPWYNNVDLDTQLRFGIPTNPELTIRIPAQSDWVDQGTILEAGALGKWDYFLWGGFAFSILKKDGIYYLYYQGASDYRSSPDETVLWHAIGVATSQDGIHFSKYAGNPILTWLPHQSGEEGAVSSGVTLGEQGETMLFYGANTEQSPTTINADVRVASSSNGLNFTDLGVVLSHSDSSVWGAGDEIFVVAAIHDQGQWIVYYIPNGTSASGLLSVAYGNQFNALDQSSVVTSNNDPISVWGTAGHIKLDSNTYALILNNVRERRTEVRLVSLQTPNLVSEPVAIYQFDEVQQAALLLDEENETWFMYYRTHENRYGLKLAPLSRGDPAP